MEWHPDFLLSALLIDAIMGEPNFMPHPVEWMGRGIDWIDQRFNCGEEKRVKGFLALIVLCLLVFALGLFLQHLLLALPFGPLWLAIGMSFFLAGRSLYDHVLAVKRALSKDISSARVEIAKICGRDPNSLDEAGISRAAIESLAESFCDGLIAPLLWGLFFGMGGLMVYKLINTADSMIGHKDDRYREFGWAAARIDDVMNWIPARISALILLAAGVITGKAAATIGTVIWTNARNHASPNAGWPESAVAGALGLSLGGPRTYQGEKTEDQWLNDGARKEATADDIGHALALYRYAWTITLLTLFLGTFIAH